MFEIRIVEKVPVKRTERGECVKLGEVADVQYVGQKRTEYGYLPDRVYDSTEDREVYKQQVDSLDLVGVITAVNTLALRPGTMVPID